jgi:hypothetical protein
MVVIVIRAIWVRGVRMVMGMATRAAGVHGLRGDTVVLIQTMGTRIWFQTGRTVGMVIENSCYTVFGAGTGKGGNGNRRDGGLQRWRDGLG